MRSPSPRRTEESGKAQGTLSFSAQVKAEVEASPARHRNAVSGERAFLRDIFISYGYMSDPRKTYRIELRIPEKEDFLKAADLLRDFDIAFTGTKREDVFVIYIRNGDAVSDFLGIIGASGCRLRFESLRTEKEVYSGINRAVNCDNANIGRQAEAGARRSELIGKLLSRPEAEKLDPELYETAVIHQSNPGASIAELGRLMNPPIGKSGMNHRLKKLVEIAEDM